MNKINRKVEYALIALKHMSRKKPGELTTVKEICRSFRCPFDATSRVMQVLAQKGILKSEQGAHGGYQITKDLKKVSLYDLIEMVLGPVEIARCLQVSEAPCDLAVQCNIVSPIHFLNERLINFYRGLSLGELVSVDHHESRPKQTHTNIEFQTGEMA